MARQIVLGFDGESSAFDFEKVERDKLYGHKERQIVDEQGQACSPALLTSDGAALVPGGGASFLYIDPRGDTFERSELRAVGADGQPLPPKRSTLGVEQPLRPADARRLLDHVTVVVYQLQPAQLGPRLTAALAARQVFETRFNYRDDYMDNPAFLLQNEAGLFLLVCAPIDFAFVAREAPAAAAVEAEGDDTLGDELDFSML